MRNKIGKDFTACFRFDHNRLDILISDDGKSWNMLQEGVDVSALNHNNYMVFYALRPTLVSYGEGEARFDNFVYKN